MLIYMTLHHGRQPIRWAMALWIPTTASFLFLFFFCSWRIFSPWHLISCWHLKAGAILYKFDTNCFSWITMHERCRVRQDNWRACLLLHDSRRQKNKTLAGKKAFISVFHHKAACNATFGSSPPAPKTHLEHPSWVKSSFDPVDGGVLARTPQGPAHSPNPSSPPSLCTRFSITGCCVVAPRTAPFCPYVPRQHRNPTGTSSSHCTAKPEMPASELTKSGVWLIWSQLFPRD